MGRPCRTTDADLGRVQQAAVNCDNGGVPSCHLSTGVILLLPHCVPATLISVLCMVFATVTCDTTHNPSSLPLQHNQPTVHDSMIGSLIFASKKNNSVADSLCHMCYHNVGTSDGIDCCRASVGCHCWKIPSGCCNAQSLC